MSPECATAPSATPTAGIFQTLRQQVWHGIKTTLGHFLNGQDPACDADIIGFCILLPFSLYWLHTRPVISEQWTICFGTIWAAVGLKAFSRRFGGGQ